MTADSRIDIDQTLVLVPGTKLSHWADVLYLVSETLAKLGAPIAASKAEREANEIVMLVMRAVQQGNAGQG